MYMQVYTYIHPYLFLDLLLATGEFGILRLHLLHPLLQGLCLLVKFTLKVLYFLQFELVVINPLLSIIQLHQRERRST